VTSFVTQHYPFFNISGANAQAQRLPLRLRSNAAVLTAPGPLNLVRAALPNRMIAMFPFTFISGFFVPAAILLQVLAKRAIRSTFAASIAPAW
jgi:hypothetical protein